MNEPKILPEKSLGSSWILLNAHTKCTGSTDKPDISCLYFLPQHLITLIATGPVASHTPPEGCPNFWLFPQPCEAGGQ